MLGGVVGGEVFVRLADVFVNGVQANSFLKCCNPEIMYGCRRGRDSLGMIMDQRRRNERVDCSPTFISPVTKNTRSTTYKSKNISYALVFPLCLLFVPLLLLE